MCMCVCVYACVCVCVCVCVRALSQDKSDSWVFEPPGAVGAHLGEEIEQNDPTDIEKAVLTPGAIGLKLKPNPREKSDYPFVFPCARAGVIFTRKKQEYVVHRKT